MTEHKSFLIDERLAAYLDAHVTPPDAVQTRLRDDTAAMGGVARMQVSHDQAVLLGIITSLQQPALAIEIGTFTGYSALAIARELPAHGRLVCCDVSERWTKRARTAWAEAGVADRIELRIGPAIDTIATLPHDRPVDLAFLDADKGGYVAYYDALVPRLRAGGLLLADNVLWDGRVVDPDADDPDTVAIRRFNDHVAADPRVRSVLLTVADGLTLVQKR